MGCVGSTESVVAHPGFAEVLAIQAITREHFASRQDLIESMDFVGSLVQREHDAAQDGAVLTIEDVAGRVAADRRTIKTLDEAPLGVPEGSIKSNLDMLEASILRKAMPKVKPAIKQAVPSKYSEPERDEAAERAVEAAVHVCVLQEVFEHFAPRHGATRRATTSRDAPDTSAAPVASFDNASGARTPEDGGGQPRYESSGTPTSHVDPHAQPASAQQQQKQDDQPSTPINKENQPEASPLSPPTDHSSPPRDEPAAATPTAKDDSVTHDDQVLGVLEEEELRYPLPDGVWVRDTENTDFYWSDDQYMFYFPAAGHYMDPESGQWYDPQADVWMEEDAHDRLLQQMAERGEY